MTKISELNKAWKDCLAMWKWIAEVYDGSKSVTNLKSIYAQKHHVPTCSFCRYAPLHSGPATCYTCPGVLVDPDFNCHRDAYNYYHKPREFYRKILSMNRKRKKQERIKRETKNARKNT